MRDEIVRAITGDGLVKAVAVTGRDVVERARNIHKLLPMSTAALGRALLGASMMGDMLKEEQGSLTLQIKGGGPLGTILAVTDWSSPTSTPRAQAVGICSLSTKYMAKSSAISPENRPIDPT